MLWFSRLLPTFCGKNLASTPKAVIVEQLNEPRALPLGRQEFEAWTDRIISGACLTIVPPRDQKFVLADMLLHLGPSEDHKPDNFFVHGLRKMAVNQVAIAMRQEIKDAQKAEQDALKDAENTVAQ